MELREIINDSLAYPLQNITAFILFLILGIIAGIVVGGTTVGMDLGITNKNVLATIGSGLIGFIIALFIGLIICGYELDVIKYGIDRRSDAPSIDILNQFFNGVKLFAVSIIYYIIPIIIVAIIAIFFQQWVIIVSGIILFVIFSLAQYMAECRLAKTGDMGYALDIGEAIGDISKVGILKLAAILILVAIVAFVLFFIAAFIIKWNSTVGGIVAGFVGVYISFFTARATGLLYSDV